MMSWEDEGEMRKFLLHIDTFFNNFYPDMEPEIEWGVPWAEYWTKLPTLMAAGEPPDLAWQHQSRGKVFPDKGWSIDLTDYIAQWPPDGWPDDWWAASVATMSYQGKVYGIPYDWATNGVYVNRDMMDPIMEYPAPDEWTTADMTEAAMAATKDVEGQRTFGLSLPTGANSIWLYVKTFGGEFFDENVTESRFNDPKTLEAIQWYWDLRWTHQVMPTPEDEQAIGISPEFAVASGRVAMRQALNDAAFRYDEAIAGKFAWGIYPMPTGPGGRFAFGGNSGWFIPTGSRYPDMAYELIRYVLSNPELLPTTGVMGSTFVGRRSFAEWGLPTGELAETIPNYEHVFVELPSQNEATFPWWPGYQEWEQIWLKWIDPILVEGQPNVEEALLGLHEETNQFLAAN
jgi:multiple sugar transport system substrate-binding protein